MDYYGLLFLYYLKGLSGKSVLRLFFNIEVGGTEQLLPENTSTPTTTPILADIQYPDGLRTDQYFTYRETPTTVSNKARIKTIKGNTLVWNQLAGTLVSTQEQSGVTFTNNGDGSITLNGTSNNISTTHPAFVANDIEWKADHRYYIELNNASLPPLLVRTITGSTGAFEFARRDTNDSKRYLINGANIGSPLGDEIGHLRFRWAGNIGLTFSNDKIIPQIFDLTQMFGAEKAEEIYQMEVNEVGSGVAYFRSLFPLSYYSYNQGSLLSFNGNGIKTVGKNLAPGISQGAVDIHGGTTSNEKRLRVDGFVRVFQGDHYTFTATSNSGKTLQIYTRYFADANGNEQVSYLDWLNLPRSVIIPSGVNYATFTIRFGNNDNITLNDISDVQVEHGTSATSYEPYTSSTLSLPISTYFPNGMQGHGDTYDELTSAVATKNFEKNSLGDLTWTRRTTNIFSANLPSEFDASKDISCFMSNRLPTGFVSGYTLAEDGYISIYKTTTVTSSTSIYLNMASQSIDTVADLQTWLSNNPTELVYPLATPTETPITTEDANEALSLLMGKSVSSSNANQLVNIITKGE